jgi:hypothetical protein
MYENAVWSRDIPSIHNFFIFGLFRLHALSMPQAPLAVPANKG